MDTLIAIAKLAFICFTLITLAIGGGVLVLALVYRFERKRELKKRGEFITATLEAERNAGLERNASTNWTSWGK